MKSLNVISYVQYFKSIASLHKSIKGFYIMDINEVLEGLRGDLKYPALILNSVSGFVSKNTNRDNILNTVKSGFLIIDHLNEISDFAGEICILGNTFDIGQAILARILHDCSLESSPLVGIDIDSIKYEMMDGIFDNDYGFLFTFDISNQIMDLSYDPTFWLTEPKSGMSGF